MPNFYEFFAGGGMARLGLGSEWQCIFANDNDAKKADSYRRRFGESDLLVADVHDIKLADLPGRAALAWASFPCQDLSLAGMGAGLQGKRSGTFWPFWQLIRGLSNQQRAPQLVVLENVCGAVTANNGRDFAEIGRAITGAGYRFGALVMDAIHFVPQSRPRLFIVAVTRDIDLSVDLARPDPSGLWHPRSLVEAKFALSKSIQDKWLWWNPPPPMPRTSVFSDLIDENPQNVEWHSRFETTRLLAMMSPLNLSKVKEAQRTAKYCVGALYRRTRKGVQRAEVRFDDVAGCLRTPRGGSSRQTLLVLRGKAIRSRLISPREAARLMGLPDDYALPNNYNDAYQLAGDGLVVPVVAHLATHLLTPIAQRTTLGNYAAA